MPIGKDETKAQFYGRLELDHWLKERLFDDEAGLETEAAEEEAPGTGEDGGAGHEAGSP